MRGHVRTGDGEELRHNWLWLTKRPSRLSEFTAHLARAGVPWPGNLWAGTSITAKHTLSRLPQLLGAPGPKTFFASVEPLTEPVCLRPWLDRLSWVIVGGESGSLTGNEIKVARPFDLAWAGRSGTNAARSASRSS